MMSFVTDLLNKWRSEISAPLPIRARADTELTRYLQEQPIDSTVTVITVITNSETGTPLMINALYAEILSFFHLIFDSCIVILSFKEKNHQKRNVHDAFKCLHLCK